MKNLVKLIKRNFSLNVNHKILSNFNNFNSLNISDDYIKSSLSSSSRIEICISNPKVFSCSNLVNDQQKYYSYKTECSNDFILSNVWLFTSNENLFKNFCIDRKKRFENILNSSVSSYFNKFQSIYLNLDGKSSIDYTLQENMKEIINSNIDVSKLNEFDFIQIREFFKLANENLLKEDSYMYYYSYLLSLVCKTHSQRPLLIISNYDEQFIQKNNLRKRFFDEIVLKNIYLEKVFLGGKYKEFIFETEILQDKNLINLNENEINIDNFKELPINDFSENPIFLNELSDQKEHLDKVFDSNEKTYVDTVKNLVNIKNQLEFKDEVDYIQIKDNLSSNSFSFNNFIMKLKTENYIKLNSNSIKFNSASKMLFNKLLNTDLHKFSYKIQLAFNYYTYLNQGKINEYLVSLKKLFEQIALNAKTEKNFEKFPNYSFRTEKELDDYLIDILTLDMNSISSKTNDKIGIYEVQDDTVSLSELKNFTLITYDDKNFAIFVKGNKLKKNAISEINEEDELDLKFEKEKKGNSTTKSLQKLNENRINSVSKSEAVNFAIKANPELKIVYILSVSNYLKQLEFTLSKVFVSPEIN